jgi:hypothetical protein
MAIAAGRVGNRYGERVAGVPGVLAISTALVWMRFVVDADEAYASRWLPAIVLTGSGMAFGYPMIQSACVRDVSSGQLSVATATNRMALQVGNAIGIAVVIAILGSADGPGAIDRYHTAWTALAVVGVVCAGLLTGVGARLPLRPGPVPARGSGARTGP